MQERGVSTRVSVKFEQVGKDGSINAAARPEQAASLPEVAPVVESRPLDDTPEPAPPRKSRNGLLKRALAGMREQSVESDSAAS